ncbi:MAG: 6-phosphogluconolactonase [Alphaproteobacteria bacterium]|nr:MAG: 6-phosphogluconolactonase [Alphaproteobacteria bacterium]
MTRLHEYGTRRQLAEALAAGVAAVLGGGIAARGSAVLAVSGGTTPALFLSRLSEADIAWESVAVTLVDERFVPSDHPRSNFRLLNETLLRNRAAAATAVPLCDGCDDLDAAARIADRRIAGLGRIDAAILGMGTDGHTASFFAGGDRLAEALDPSSRRHVVAMMAPGVPEPRLTLTLRYLLDAHFLALHIEGKDKKTVCKAALGDGPVEQMPVRAVIRGAGDRLNLFWAP